MHVLVQQLIKINNNSGGFGHEFATIDFLLSRVIHDCYHSILSTVNRTLMHAMVTEGSFIFLVEFLCNLRFLKLPVDGIMTSLVHLTSDDFDLPTPWPSTICGVKNFRSTSK